MSFVIPMSFLLNIGCQMAVEHPRNALSTNITHAHHAEISYSVERDDGNFETLSYVMEKEGLKRLAVSCSELKDVKHVPGDIDAIGQAKIELRDAHDNTLHTFQVFPEFILFDIDSIQFKGLLANGSLYGQLIRSESDDRTDQ